MSRKSILQAILRHARLVTPSPIALRVVNVASRPDCTIPEIADILGQDPVLCGKVLKTVNSCVYTPGRRPVATVEGAVMMLGLNPLRSLVLGLSLPIAQSDARPDSVLRDFWVDAVSGGILAKELSLHAQGQAPGYDLVAGLLQNLGLLMLAEQDPAGWRRYSEVPAEEALTDPLAIEERIFGVNHVEVTCTLLTSWNLPDDVLEPVRHHHAPDGLRTYNRRSWHTRAELLNFVDALVHLDRVAESPVLLKDLLARAVTLFGMGQQALIEFLQRVAPKIEEVKTVFELDVHGSQDYSAVLGRGCEALVDLSFRNQFEFLTAPPDAPAVGREPATRATPVQPRVLVVGPEATIGLPPSSPPAFQPEFMTRFPAGGFRIDQFDVRHELGRGAMGVVYAGYDEAVCREVAIKVMAPTYATSNDARARFAREARALAAIRHPNIVGVYTVGTIDRLPYIAMEHVRGLPLEELVQQVGPLPIDRIVDYGRQIADGMAAAHQKGIVHRDLKPANILVDTTENQIKVGDFGLARGLDNLGITQAGTLIGSPLYMSPEQIDGQPADARSDLFSLGSVFYYMCTGRLPFDSPTITGLLRQIGNCDPVPPKHLRAVLPEELDVVVMNLLKRDPADRIQTATDLRARLELLDSVSA
ncbi:protein kinase domain-containing protein [Limnoglobus roseus]|uniref:HDOD domain-containing protein n=1 Tax=Limnoglobus roseus TaxID=2598579 RepID=A0A5C1APS3_9BACT|nr:HDOD domain-containing protein [Limnoglobus roseus]QEL20595.1 HDOD domain-containing protein [Limnoglobus roseus]